MKNQLFSAHSFALSACGTHIMLRLGEPTAETATAMLQRASL